MNDRTHRDYRGPKRPTMRVPGIYAEDMNLTGQKSVKDCRLTASAVPHVRSKSTVRPCGGYVEQSQDAPRKVYSKNARRKMERYGAASGKRKRA